MVAFRRAGYAVVGTPRSIRPSDEGDFTTVPGDISEVETAQRVMEQALGRFGRVDGILYLEQATFVTGEILHIDGGQAAGH